MRIAKHLLIIYYINLSIKIKFVLLKIYKSIFLIKPCKDTNLNAKAY